MTAEVESGGRTRLGRLGRRFSTGVIPGLALTSGIAALAFAIRQLPGFGLLSPMILAILIATAFHNLVGTPAWAKAGVAFSLRRILRFAIILLGFQLTLSQLREVGSSGFALIVATLVATFLVTKWLARPFGVDPKLAELIAAGTSICGASAVIATNSVTHSSEEDVTYAVAAVTVLGSLAMFLWPLLPGALHLGPRAYGLWAGASIHEIAQVVAAAFQNGPESGDFGTIAKLSRVMLLAPLVILLGLWHRLRSHGGASGAKAPFPWFVLGFIAVILVNSAIALPTPARDAIVRTTPFMLSVALAAMGLLTDIRKLRAKGMRPFLLACASWLFIAGFSLALVQLWAEAG